MIDYEFLGVLLPHIASIAFEFVVLVWACFGRTHLDFDEEEVRSIADIARNDQRSSKEAVASYARHFGFRELLRGYFWQGILLVVFNTCNMLGVYLEEIFEKPNDHPSVWILPSARVVVAVMMGAVALYLWNRKKGGLTFRKQVRSALLVSHATTLLAVALCAYGSATIWRMAHP